MKIKLELSIQELLDLSSAIADGCRQEINLTTIRNKKIRKIMADSVLRKHKLWKKIIHQADKY